MDDRAQAAVELAMVLPVLLLITVAVCQLALALNCYIVITSAGRDGARCAAATNDRAAGEKATLASASGLPGERPSVEITFPEGREKGSPVSVSVSYRMPLLLPGLDKVVPRPLFKASASMALERGVE
ncbi:MAG: TadE family protein [Candidatus Geothermincolia bacterium]